MFQSTPSGGKATAPRAPRDGRRSVSIHAFRGEGDRAPEQTPEKALKFQSTPSGGKATSQCDTSCHPYAKRFNPRLPGGRRPGVIAASGGNAASFNPRLPGGRRRTTSTGVIASGGFQSTPSGGKATFQLPADRRSPDCFNPRLPGGRRLNEELRETRLRQVSIHAFRGEGDGRCMLRIPPITRGFNPRLPGGRRRPAVTYTHWVSRVSIHAFRGEGDQEGDPRYRSNACFNPRLPGGRRPACVRCFSSRISFNPRLPGGRRRPRCPPPLLP